MIEELRRLITELELKGDWDQAETIKKATDRLLTVEAQNQAYRHALQSGVSINLVGKRHWFKRNLIV